MERGPRPTTQQHMIVKPKITKMDYGYYDSQLEWPYQDEDVELEVCDYPDDGSDEEMDYPDTEEEEDCCSSDEYAELSDDDVPCNIMADEMAALKKRLACVEENPGPCKKCGRDMECEPGDDECARLLDESIGKALEGKCKKCTGEAHEGECPEVVERITCAKCGEWGHEAGDQECPYGPACPICMNEYKHEQGDQVCVDHIKSRIKHWANVCAGGFQEVNIEPLMALNKPGEILAAWKELRNNVPKGLQFPSAPKEVPAVEGKGKEKEDQNPRCRICKNTDHQWERCPKIKCSKCKQFGHVARLCLGKEYKPKGKSGAHKNEIIMRDEANRQAAEDKGDADAAKMKNDADIEDEELAKLEEELGKTKFDSKDADLMKKVQDIINARKAGHAPPTPPGPPAPAGPPAGPAAPAPPPPQPAEPQPEINIDALWINRFEHFKVKWTTPGSSAGLCALWIIPALCPVGALWKTLRTVVSTETLRNRAVELMRNILGGGQIILGSERRLRLCSREDLIEFLAYPGKIIAGNHMRPSFGDYFTSALKGAALGVAAGLACVFTYSIVKARWNGQQFKLWSKPEPRVHRIKFKRWLADPLHSLPDMRAAVHARGELLKTNPAIAQLDYTIQEPGSKKVKVKLHCALEALTQVATFGNLNPFMKADVSSQKVIQAISRMQCVNLDKLDALDDMDPTTTVAFVAHALSLQKKQKFEKWGAMALFRHTGAIDGSP